MIPLKYTKRRKDNNPGSAQFAIHSIFTAMKHLLLSVIFSLSLAGLHAQPGVVIDRTVAVVGGNVILMSDIENQMMQLRLQGYSGSDTRCDIFEEMLFQKLMLNQAEVDSIEIGEEEVELQLDRRINYFVSQFGGDQKKMEEFYGKTINEIKEEFRDLLRDQMLIEKVQQGIISDVKVTPSEVKSFFNTFPEDSLPLIDAEYEVSHIVRTPKVTFQEKEKARKKIDGFRNRAVEGEDFTVLAALYSEDPGSAAKGGELGMFGRGVMAPEFEAAAFALKTPGEISPVIETEFGFHVLELIADRKSVV